MFHNLITTALLAIAPMDAPAPAPSADATSVVQQSRRYWVQFRQPEWRDQTFYSRYEMDVFLDDKRRNGWEVQVFPYELRARFRLTQWGGSRTFDTLPEAQQWAAYLDRELGYQPRIVDLP
jgi:hypothetical protein